MLTRNHKLEDKHNEEKDIFWDNLKTKWIYLTTELSLWKTLIVECELAVSPNMEW